MLYRKRSVGLIRVLQFLNRKVIVSFSSIPILSLTVDDPTPDQAKVLCEHFSCAQISATFFIRIETWTDQDPGSVILRQMLAAGHEVGICLRSAEGISIDRSKSVDALIWEIEQRVRTLGDIHLSGASLRLDYSNAALKKWLNKTFGYVRVVDGHCNLRLIDIGALSSVFLVDMEAISACAEDVIARSGWLIATIDSDALGGTLASTIQLAIRLVAEMRQRGVEVVCVANGLGRVAHPIPK